jgi:hypothetical protein
LDEWAGRAPAEIAGDVAVLARGMRGLIDLLEEYDFDLVALADAESEPRLQALEDPEFEAASLRVSQYCGLPPGPSIGGVDSGPTGSTGGGSATGSDSSAVPDDFPRELVPPDSTVVVVGSAGFGFGPTVEFTSTADTADVFAHYEEVLGAPTFVESGGTSWSFITDTGLVTISITGTDGAVAIQIIIVIND